VPPGPLAPLYIDSLSPLQIIIRHEAPSVFIPEKEIFLLFYMKWPFSGIHAEHFVELLREMCRLQTKVAYLFPNMNTHTLRKTFAVRASASLNSCSGLHACR
jgi:hypothetical protein